MIHKMHLLFSYGTLQLEKVQLENYGRILKGHRARLLKYKLGKLKIADKKVVEQSGLEFHPIAIKTESVNDFVEGTIFEITESELAATDKYEVGDYNRVLETFSTGHQAWVYVARQNKSGTSIEENISRVKKRIEEACQYSNRKQQEIKMLLATKTVNSNRIKEAFECGETFIAENKVQEVNQKYHDLGHFAFEQHFIGHLQSNKIKDLLRSNVSCIQSIDRISLVEKLHPRLLREGRTMDILIQVNTSNESSKFGVKPHEVINFVRQVSTFETVRIKGLMTIGLFSADTEKVRSCYKRLKAIQQKVLEEEIPKVEMKELSMGMSGDFEIAIEEGATIIRVGTAIFGERHYPDHYYWMETD